MSRGRRSRSSDDEAIGCLVYAILAVFLMPFFGLAFVLGKDPEKKTLGWVLLVVGIILWIVIGVGSG
jgi:hypothetical protein